MQSEKFVIVLVLGILVLAGIPGAAAQNNTSGTTDDRIRIPFTNFSISGSPWEAAKEHVAWSRDFWKGWWIIALLVEIIVGLFLVVFMFNWITSHLMGVVLFFIIVTAAVAAFGPLGVGDSVIGWFKSINVNEIINQTIDNASAQALGPSLKHMYNEVDLFRACSYYRLNDFDMVSVLSENTLKTESTITRKGKISGGAWQWLMNEPYTVDVISGFNEYAAPCEIEDKACVKDPDDRSCRPINTLCTFNDPLYTQSIRYRQVWHDFSEFNEKIIAKPKTQLVRFCGDIERTMTPAGWEISVDIVPEFYGVVYSKYAWINSTWGKKKPIEIYVTSGTTEKDFQVLLNVTYDSDMNADFSDLRFTNGSEDTELDYWVQYFDASSYADVWVEIDQNISTNNYTIYMYYNNSAATSASNITSTFVLGDEFSDTDFTDFWDDGSQLMTATTIEEKDGFLNITGKATSQYWRAAGWINSTSPFGHTDQSWALEGDMQWDLISAAFNNGASWLSMFVNETDSTAIAEENLAAIAAFQWDNTKALNTAANGGRDSDTWTGTLTASYSDASWHHLKIIWNASDGQLWYYDDNGAVTNHTMGWGGDLYARLNIIFRATNDRIMGGWDNVTVRKYHSPEPLSGFGAEESPAAGDRIYNVTLLTPASGYNTSDNTPAHTFTVNGTYGDYSCTLFYNDTALDTDTSVLNATETTLTVNTSRADGQYEWWINCTNSTSTSKSDTTMYIHVDTTSPDITVTFPSNNSNLSVSWINITGSASDPHPDSVTINDTNFTGNLGTYTSWNFTNSSIDEGSYSLLITANDSVGNSNTTEVLFTIDRTAPTITFVTPTPADGSSPETYTVTINVSLSEAGSSVLLDWQGTNYTMPGSGTSWTLTFNDTDIITETTYIYTVYANDSAGNLAGSAQRTVTPVHDAGHTSGITIPVHNPGVLIKELEYEVALGVYESSEYVVEIYNKINNDIVVEINTTLHVSTKYLQIKSHSNKSVTFTFVGTGVDQIYEPEFKVTSGIIKGSMYGRYKVLNKETDSWAILMNWIRTNVLMLFLAGFAIIVVCIVYFVFLKK